MGKETEQDQLEIFKERIKYFLTEIKSFFSKLTKQGLSAKFFDQLNELEQEYLAVLSKRDTFPHDEELDQQFEQISQQFEIIRKQIGQPTQLEVVAASLESSEAEETSDLRGLTHESSANSEDKNDFFLSTLARSFLLLTIKLIKFLWSGGPTTANPNKKPRRHRW